MLLKLYVIWVYNLQIDWNDGQNINGWSNKNRSRFRTGVSCLQTNQLNIATPRDLSSKTSLEPIDKMSIIEEQTRIRIALIIAASAGAQEHKFRGTYIDIINSYKH